MNAKKVANASFTLSKYTSKSQREISIRLLYSYIENSNVSPIVQVAGQHRGATVVDAGLS
jgi:hypothetical protein